MNSKLMSPLAAAAFACLLLTACGGGGGDAPSADAAASPSAAPPATAAAAPAADERAQAMGVPMVGALVPPVGTPSGNFDCINNTVGRATLDNLVVPAGAACRLKGTTIRGSVEVQEGATLDASEIVVAGNFQGSMAAHVSLTGNSRVGGAAQFEGGGSVSLEGNRMSDIVVEGLTGAVSVRANSVTGNLQAQGNTGGVALFDNLIGGNLQCQDNLPAPVFGGNQVALAQDQCAGGEGGGAGGGDVPPPLTGNVTCIGLTIGAIQLDSVIVPPRARCVLQGTRLNGSLEVGASATVQASNVVANGELLADGAASVQVDGASRFAGVKLQRGSGASIVGAVVAGDMQIDAMRGPSTVSSNRISGNFQAMDNRARVSITSNQIAGNMQCKGNVPAPTGRNNTAAQKQDQCAGL
jgi:hypothetical protein